MGFLWKHIPYSCIEIVVSCSCMGVCILAGTLSLRCARSGTKLTGPLSQTCLLRADGRKGPAPDRYAHVAVNEHC